MYKLFYLLSWSFLLVRCTGAIKNTEAQIIEEAGTQIADSTSVGADKKVIHGDYAKLASPKGGSPLIGYWVGYFREDRGERTRESKTLYVDEGYMWSRENKINISIDSINHPNVWGHSVVAGNDRPFEGLVESMVDNYTRDTLHRFDVHEPGDDQYDGRFTFEISNNQLTGTWQAYHAIEIPRRKYTLERKTFAYDPDIRLERAKRYVDWQNVSEAEQTADYGDGEVETWISQKFASASDQIYTLNASNTLLDKSKVENLKRGDLIIVRNTIYARHGYSFKNRPLRVFFDAQPWYIPVHADIRNDFTDIEKQNIQLLLRYEENAAEYYDYFGRG